MANLHVNKVAVNGQTVLDLSGDTVYPGMLAKGITAHDKSGAQITGTLEVPATEELTVELSMLSGNQVILPTSGKVMRKVTVQKPDTLLSENIKKDVVIGGVTGALEAGGGSVQPSKSVSITQNGTTTVTPDTGYDALGKVDVTVDVPKIDYNTIASTWEKHDFDFNNYDFEGTEIPATGTATGLFAVLSENDTTSFIVFTTGIPQAGTAPQLAIGGLLWSFNAMDNGVSILSDGDAAAYFNATPYIYIQTT